MDHRPRFRQGIGSPPPPTTSPSTQIPSDDSDKELAKVAEFLGVEQAPEDDHSYFSDKRVEGTCEFFLEHEAFRLWAKDPTAKFNVLWCYGKPGTGKSVIASHVVNFFKDASLPCAYYYFRSGNQVKNTLTHFILSVAFQLASLNAEYRRKLCRLVDEGSSISNAGFKMLWKRLFMSTLLKTHLKGPVYLVVDGLDELDMAMAKELISKMFVELSETSQPIRVLLVGRPIPDIELVMDQLARHLRPPNTLRRLALNGNEADLELYVEVKMQSMFGDDNLKRDTAARVLRKAEGNFLWVCLVVREILESITMDDVEKSLMTIPQEMTPLYTRMDQRLADAFRLTPKDKQLGQAILIWASCSRYPLLLEELAEALDPEFSRIIDTRQTVQKFCGEFVIVDQKNFLSIMHASARDFLFSNSALNCQIQADRAHQSLFRKCIQKLSDCHVQIRQTISKARNFVKYAADAWPFHLTASCAWLDQESLSALVAFFQDRSVIDWMFILASAGQLRVLVAASEALTNFIKSVEVIDQGRTPPQHRFSDREYIVSWAQDLTRVVGKFGMQMLQHPTAIYDLIPTFSPRSSHLFKQFAVKIPGAGLRTRGSYFTDWDDCLAKFVVPGQRSPQSIVTLERHFAILASDGIVRLFNSNTCEEVRAFEHGEIVFASSFNATSDLLATYGLYKTKIWDTRTARHLFTIENPRYTKALALCFRMSEENKETLLSISDDNLVRYCSIDTAFFEWTIMGTCKANFKSTRGQIYSYPRTAEFSPDGLQIAISYRGVHPVVWALDGEQPEFVAQCEARTYSYLASTTTHVNNVYAQAYCWNPASGHLLGIYNDGCVFKWHPTRDEYEMSNIRSNGIKCSANGKLFVTSSGDGTLRVWDFERFIPIYQSSFPQGVNDIAIDRNEARIYDIRDTYCNIWQPNALLLSMEMDDMASETRSSHDSSNQISPVSKGDGAMFEPITALTVSGLRNSYAIGNDAGEAFIGNYDGEMIAKFSQSIMSVELIAYCESCDIAAIVDLSRNVTVQRICRSEGADRENVSGTTLFSFSESDSVVQVLFDKKGKMLLVVTTTALRTYDIDARKLFEVTVEPRKYHWINHPHDSLLLLGFASDSLKIVPWQGLTNATTYQYDKAAFSNAPSFLRTGAGGPSEAYPMEPSDIGTFTEKVFMSPDQRHFLTQIRHSSIQYHRRIDHLLVEIVHTRQTPSAPHISVRPLPSYLAHHMKIALGFVGVDHAIVSQSREPFTPTIFNTRKAVPRPQINEQTFAFIDQNFWVCTGNIGPDDSMQRPIRKHFFLPQDWRNAEWLELATITSDGTFLCPRNGVVVAVSDGLTHDWKDD